MQGRSLAIATFAVTSVALVMVMLDNLVVSTALNVIRQELGALRPHLRVVTNNTLSTPGGGGTPRVDPAEPLAD